MKKIIALLACAMLLTACAKNMNSNVYTENGVAGKVLEGKVISVRQVTIKEHDKLQQNTTGALLGGTAGGVAGAQIGNGNGSLGAAVAGALIGAVAGAVAEDALNTQEGTEYLVKLDKKYLQEYRNITKRVQSGGKNSVQQDITNSSDVSTKTDIVSVVQATDPELHKGSRVYVIYSDDRPRVTAAE